MKRFNTTLFLATVASGALIASNAYADTIPAPFSNDGDAALHGTGATSIQNVLVQEFNCIAKNNNLGSANNSQTTFVEPTDLPIDGGSTFNCAADQTDPNAALQPNFSAKYVGTGSGFGRQAWRNTTNQFGGTTLNPFGPWNTVQFAFADSVPNATDLNTTYPANIAPTGGAAVLFPKYVLPVAIAYNSVYGLKPRIIGGSTPLSFNVAWTGRILGTVAGGLKMNRTTYCKVFNGEIVNFNDPAFTADNTSPTSPNGVSLMDSNDNVTRWNTDGVPIRLVGRLDRSGTTDIFTRALAAQCTGLVAVNKYTGHAETLPYNRGNTASLPEGVPDFQAVRSDTGLRAASTETVAGTTNMVSKQYYNGTVITDANVTGGGKDATPVVIAGKAQGSGLFIVADGSSRLAGAINLAPDYASPSNGWLLNGKIGYIGADFIVPSPTNQGLFAAALSSETAPTTASSYAMPSAANGTTAVGSVLPPQSDATGGYLASGGSAGLRANPADWYAVLYPTTGATLASPTSGYPITGTTQFLGYSCYKAGNAENIKTFLGWNAGTVTTDYAGVSKAGIFTTTGADYASSGLLIRSNIGAMPATWQKAVGETFLSDPHGLNLEIQAVGGTGKCASLNGM